jgi:indolepyruvate ferredoxin oxidoreductase beta subunit
MPTPGDVDVVMAAELMEAGRSVLRGLVTPDKTTLIASTHRAYAVIEKEKPGDGAGDPFAVVDALDFAARRTIAFDMEKLAVERGTVISAAMLGALAGSGALPFERPAYEAVVRKAARGANASLAAFADAYDRARAGEREAPKTGPVKRLDDLPEDAGHTELNRLVARLRSELPEGSRRLAFAGLKRIVDFQDVAYGDEYVDRLQKLAGIDAANGGAAKNFAFTAEAAKRLAVAMAYDDVIRVADIKTRPSRFARLREEAGAAADQIIYATEYLHPRGEEICGMLPAPLGAFIEARPFLFRTLDRLVNRGRRVPVARIGGFLQLYCVAALRPTRRSSLRHKRETEHREAWLAQAADILPKNYDLAVEILRCRRLVKGYSDTHARSFSKFDRVMAKAPQLVARADGAQWMARLIAAALIDEPGDALDGVAKTIDTL